MADLYGFRVVLDVVVATHDTKKEVRRELHRRLEEGLRDDRTLSPIDDIDALVMASTDIDAVTDLAADLEEFLERHDNHEWQRLPLPPFYRATQRWRQDHPVLAGELVGCPHCGRPSGCEHDQEDKR